MRYAAFAAGVYTGIAVAAAVSVHYALGMLRDHYLGEWRP